MKLTARETALFAMLGALMYASKALLSVLPNVHLLAMFLTAFTLVYGKKALYPLYVFVFLTGLFGGFGTWWLPHLYIWLPLWGAVMLLPRTLPGPIAPFVYMAVAGLHGLLYGILYAPAQALLFGLNFRGMLAWIAAGLPWDVLHGASNFLCGALILPVAKLLRQLEHGLPAP